MRALFVSIFCLVFAQLQAQIVITDPPFPTSDELVTLTYDANLGNGELAGVVPVYAHIGVITNLSIDESDWQHVIGEWGTADSDVLMSPEGGGVHSFDFGGQTLSDFFSLNDGEVIEKLAMVFRNQSGSLVGRETDGSDIYYCLTDGSYSVQVFTDLDQHCTALDVGAIADFEFLFSETSDIEVYINGDLVASAEDANSLDYTFTAEDAGNQWFEVIGDNGDEEVSDSFNVVVTGENIVEASPAGIIDGINYIDENTVVLQFYAPLKDHLFVVGDFNDWVLDADYQMKVTPDGQTFWLEIGGLTAGQEYRFQYHITNDCMRVAEYYADKLLHKWDDPWIPDVTYPDLLEYPEGLTDFMVSVLQTEQPEFDWTDDDYEVPDAQNLIIYELLIRDFTVQRTYQSVIDKLDYLEDLNVNAIELMPVYEFEGNESWGYNGSFFFAPDKYYGTEDDFKTFVDECHARGIAVIMDIALNHSFGQNPQVRMYFDPDLGDWGQPTAQNPWFNETPKHDFNVGYDYNHESQRTRDFCKRVFAYWLEEYHIDGYRMDLAKGFTQNYTLGNLGAWAAYDQSRVDILNDYKNHMESVKPDVIVALEHLADNSEEIALAEDGFFLWGKLNEEYNEGTMGYSTNFSWGSYQERGWNEPQLITYMESHDEERLMYKNLEYGNSNGAYDITELGTALDRIEMAFAFLIPIPGPKMIWQFGELGYDYPINYCWWDESIDEECRTYPKPVRWDYLDDPNREHVYQVASAINHLKLTETAFQTTDFNLDVGGYGKRIHLNHPDMNVCIVGNFDVTGIDMIPGFQQTGPWYDYFTGAEINVTDLGASMYFEPGEWHIYTDEELEVPDTGNGIVTSTESEFILYPNPTNSIVTIQGEKEIRSIDIMSTLGNVVRHIELNNGRKTTEINVSDLSTGIYWVRVNDDLGGTTIPLIME
jgi:hypothetical protein